VKDTTQGSTGSTGSRFQVSGALEYRSWWFKSLAKKSLWTKNRHIPTIFIYIWLLYILLSLLTHGINQCSWPNSQSSRARSGRRPLAPRYDGAADMLWHNGTFGQRMSANENRILAQCIWDPTLMGIWTVNPNSLGAFHPLIINGGKGNSLLNSCLNRKILEVNSDLSIAIFDYQRFIFRSHLFEYYHLVI